MKTEFEDSGICFSLGEPDWSIGFSTEFVKSIAKLDKNKRARLLEAIRRLAEAPTSTHGDTVKPLTGNLAGFWRYRETRPSQRLPPSSSMRLPEIEQANGSARYHWSPATYSLRYRG